MFMLYRWMCIVNVKELEVSNCVWTKLLELYSWIWF